MIAVLVPCLGQCSEIFIDRHIYGLAEMEPVVYTLRLAERRVEIPTVVIGTQSKIVNKLSNLWTHASCFWDMHIMHRQYLWEARSFGAGQKLAGHLARPDLELVLIHFENMGTSFIPQLSQIRVPIVVICHGKEMFPGGKHGPYLKRLRRLFDMADKVLCVSKYIRDYVIKYGCPEEKADVFYLGAELPEICCGHKDTKQCTRYIMTGRIIPCKGHETLIYAFAEILRNIKDAELVLIGDGPSRSKLQSLAHSLGIADAVKFLGFQVNSKVYEELGTADIYVHPSYEEGLGISIVEAMAACLPVVATAVGGIPEIVEDGKTGFLVPPKDVDRLTEAMLILAKDPLLRIRMGFAGRQVVEDKFDVHKQNKHCVKFLRQLISLGV